MVEGLEIGVGGGGWGGEKRFYWCVNTSKGYPLTFRLNQTSIFRKGNPLVPDHKKSPVTFGLLPLRFCTKIEYLKEPLKSIFNHIL